MKSRPTELLLKRFDSCIEKEEKNFEQKNIFILLYQTSACSKK